MAVARAVDVPQKDSVLPESYTTVMGNEKRSKSDWKHHSCCWPLHFWKIGYQVVRHNCISTASAHGLPNFMGLSLFNLVGFLWNLQEPPMIRLWEWRSHIVPSLVLSTNSTGIWDWRSDFLSSLVKFGYNINWISHFFFPNSLLISGLDFANTANQTFRYVCIYRQYSPIINEYMFQTNYNVLINQIVYW